MVLPENAGETDTARKRIQANLLPGFGILRGEHGG